MSMLTTPKSHIEKYLNNFLEKDQFPFFLMAQDGSCTLFTNVTTVDSMLAFTPHAHNNRLLIFHRTLNLFMVREVKSYHEAGRFFRDFLDLVKQRS